MSYNYLFKVIVTGEQNSGKTSLVRRISDDNFRDYTDTTIGVEFVSVEREIGGQRIKYHFWDTAGQESFAPIIKNYYKGVASGFLVVDGTEPEWKEQMKKWYDRYQRHRDEYSLPLIAILNKIDLPLKADVDEFKKYAEELGMVGYDISVKTTANTRQLLEKMTEHIMKKIEEGVYIPGVRKGIDIRKIEEELVIEQGLYDKCCMIQ
jgi:small GTP-binding protein